MKTSYNSLEYLSLYRRIISLSSLEYTKISYKSAYEGRSDTHGCGREWVEHNLGPKFQRQEFVYEKRITERTSLR